jgi:NTE family protein
MMKKYALRMVILILAFGVCALHRQRAKPTLRSQSGYRFDTLDSGPRNSDSLFVCFMFSGGGTRAAALSYGIMEANINCYRF